MSPGRTFFWASCLIGLLVGSRTAARGQDAALLAMKGNPSAERDSLRKKQQQWILQGRTVPGQASARLRYGAIQAKLRMRTGRQALSQSALKAVPHAANPSGWTSIGPAPLASDASGSGGQDYNWVSGRATAVAVDPNDASGNTVYVGGAYGGLWKSENAGPLCADPSTVTWNAPPNVSPRSCLGMAGSSPLSLLDDQPSLSVGAIAIQPQPTNPDSSKSVILVGTGETNSSADSYYGLGILRSTDAGSTWNLVGQDASGTHSFAGIGFSQIAFSTGNPNLVVAAAAGTSQGELEGVQNPVSANLGLYFSIDGGQSWNYATVMDGAATALPGSATSVAYNAAAGMFVAALRFHGFYTSNDGVHWLRLVNQPGNGLTSSACPASPALQSCPIYRGEIAIVPKRAGASGLGEIYVWYVDASDADQGIWKSVDGGATWTGISDAGVASCGDLLGGCGTQNGSYNLALAAVPDNPDPNATTGTDLYAGAVNLYKCVTLGTISNCSGAAPNTFLNLTHAYGCPPDFGSIAKVHPSQHGIDFMRINGGSQVVMYFANDGGITRTLDGYAGLISGDCSTPNQFDSLNQTLGSMTQFVALAQHPSDPNTLLGGTQGNGSPATGLSQISSQWNSVNSADGGFSEINPDDPTEWFTENTGVSIQRCGLGIDCRPGDFNSDMVVSGATLGGDAGPLHTPYVLDPQNSGEMIVGTCRVWRGTTQGASFTALSSNFETGSDAACTGAEINTVRSLAAGGPVDINGFSSVLYAGTNGTGPLASSAGGHVWVMKTATDGTTSWADVTGPVNPDHFPVSSIAIDVADQTGQTAFVAIMGFHVSHVWKTTNAGNSWSDFSGSLSSSLPDAPANTILVDSGTVYVGTDVGVFSSGTNNPSWTEVGPMPVPNGPGTGYLPDVPVTRLRIFNNGPTKLLRAATYGRGVWQFPLATAPDFEIAFASATQYGFAGQTVTISGVLTAFDSFSSPVTLTCSGSSLPGLCNVASSPITPTGPSTAFAVAVGGAAGDYAFNVTGTGSGLSRSSALTLHVVDFSLAAPSPASLSVGSGATSASSTLQLQLDGSFPSGASVHFACNAPAGLSCNFFPSDTVSASSGPTATITLTVSASSSAALGNSVINISATSTDAGSKTLSEPLAVTVTSSQDYSLTVGSASSAVPKGQNLVLTGTVTGLNGYNNTVRLTCVDGSTAMPPTCGLSPTALNANASSAGFSLTASSNAAGSYSFGVQGVGSDVATITHVTPVSISFFDFALNADSPSTQTINAGQSASYSLTFTPEGPSTFPEAVSYGCGTLPALTTCSFDPAQIPSGSGIVKVKLTITTVAAIAALEKPGTRQRKRPLLALLLPLAGLVVALGGTANRRRQGLAGYAAFLALLVLVILQAACGGGLVGGSGSGNPAQPGTTPGTYTVMINATEGSGSQALQAPAVALTLTVQ